MFELHNVNTNRVFVTGCLTFSTFLALAPEVQLYKFCTTRPYQTMKLGNMSCGESISEYSVRGVPQGSILGPVAYSIYVVHTLLLFRK